jgi:hypothetical protein
LEIFRAERTVACPLISDRRLTAEISAAYEPLILALTLLNVFLVTSPRRSIAIRQVTMIRASMTAYSTAVGPSSETRKRLILSAIGRMISPVLKKPWPDWILPS